MVELLNHIVETDRGLPDLTTLPAEEGREIERRLSKRWRTDMPEVARLDVLEIGEIAAKAHLVEPPSNRDGVILFLHGGGWAFGGFHTHEDPIRRLSLATGMTVIALEYRLAPEHPFPTGLNDCIAAWRALVGSRVPGIPQKGPLIIAGDSAGANLAISTTLNELEEGRQPPDACVLVYGVYGTDFSTPSYRQFADGPVLTRDKMQQLWDWYCPAKDRSDFRATPLSAPVALLKALPPLYIAAAEVDPLLSDSEKLMERLPTNRAIDRFVLWPGLVHGSLGMGGLLPEIRGHIRDIGRWVAERFPVEVGVQAVPT